MKYVLDGVCPNRSFPKSTRPDMPLSARHQAQAVAAIRAYESMTDGMVRAVIAA